MACFFVPIVAAGVAGVGILIANALGQHNTVSFTTSGVTRESYLNFIQELRGHLASGQESHGVSVLRNPDGVPDAERHLLVELSTGTDTITVALDVTNVYVLGYAAGEDSYFFRDTTQSAVFNLFTDTNRHSFEITGNYTDLERAAGNREGIELGIPALADSISTLRHTNRFSDQRTVFRSLLVVIQMVSEAARYHFIANRVRDSIGDTRNNELFRPDGHMISLENEWRPLSIQVQRARPDGSFCSSIQLQRVNYTIVVVDRVPDRLQQQVALLLYDRGR